MNDIDPQARVVTGERVVAEAIARRLMTPRGRLIGYPNYGFDLTQYVNADVSPRDIVGIRNGIAAECVKDDRVLKADASIVLADDSTFTVTIVLIGTQGPFTLVLGVSAVTVSILDIAA